MNLPGWGGGGHHRGTDHRLLSPFRLTSVRPGSPPRNPPAHRTLLCWGRSPPWWLGPASASDWGGASGEWALIFLCPKCVFLLRLLLLKARDFSKSPSSDFRFTQTEAVFPLRVETRPTAGSMFSCPSPPAPLLQLQGGAVAPPCLVQLLHCPTFPGTCRPQFGASTSPEVVVGRAMPISHSRSWLASDKIGLKS